jgi:hypothetical protein
VWVAYISGLALGLKLRRSWALDGIDVMIVAAALSVAIDGSKFKAVNNRDENFTGAKVERRRTQLEQSVARYLAQLDTTDRQERSETIELKKTRLREKLTKLKSEMAELGSHRETALGDTRPTDLTDRPR